MQADESRHKDSFDTAPPAASIDLGARIRQLWSGRYWIMAGGLCTAIATAILALTMVPIYRATVLLVPASDERNSLGGVLDSTFSRLGGLASLAGINVNAGNAQTQEALAVLKSRQFTEKFIADNNLMPRLFASRWDAQAGKWKGEQATWPTPVRGFKYFNGSIRYVTEDKKTGIIRLQIDWRDRGEAATWANKLIQRLNAEMRQRAIARADASVGYLKQELADTADVGTRDAINRLIEMQIRQRMLANVTDEYAFRVIDPALPPEPNDRVRPKRTLMVLIGGMLGGFLSCVFVLIFRRKAVGR